VPDSLRLEVSAALAESKPSHGVDLDDAVGRSASMSIDGYHDLTKDGQPVSKVFVKTTLADKQLVSVTAAHDVPLAVP